MSWAATVSDPGEVAGQQRDGALEAGPATLTATAYYTSGYRSPAEDQNGAGTGHDCSTALHDPANYAAVNYNPTWSYGGIIGRMFRVGAKVTF